MIATLVRAAAAAAGICLATAIGAAAPQAVPVAIDVDTASRLGPMTPIWAYFGYDEPNYTYTADGRKLLSELADASPVPVFVRVHNLLTTGDGTPALKWGSTNAYTEDASGRPRDDWTIVDRIFDTYRERRMRPIVQLGFMPEALSSHPEPYRHFWKPGDNYNDIYTGWSYPPVDYAKWSALVEALTRHLVERYGRAEVERWWFEVWNEPDIGYWHGSMDEYFTLYDFAAAGFKRALPTGRIGGPETTGPAGAKASQWLRAFLEHCLHGTNAATGAIGAPLDLITFHAKGAPAVQPDGHVRMGVSAQLRSIDAGFSIVTSFPAFASLPIVIGESDPEGCAACPVRTNPANAYRNGTMYSSYTAEQIARTYALADAHQVHLAGAVTWAFLFEGQPYFDGFRDLATNGIDKPVVNVFRMLGRMSGDRVAVTSSGALSLADVRDRGVRDAADVSALATRAARSAAVLLWNYHDDDEAGPAAEIALTVRGLPGGHVSLSRFQVDEDHGNAYARWKAMGRPQTPTPGQIADLERASALAAIGAPARVRASNGAVTVPIVLPRQGVALVSLSW